MSETADSIRAFIAIELPGELREELAVLIKRMRGTQTRVSWVTAERMHLTLRFLGSVPQDTIAELSARLRRTYAAATPFELHARGVGAFPNSRAPRVIWAGLEPLEGPLAEVQAQAETAAQSIGLCPEKQRFKAHVTLGRVRDERVDNTLINLLHRERAFAGGSFLVSGVSLFSSELRPNGPVYTRLESFSFT